MHIQNNSKLNSVYSKVKNKISYEPYLNDIHITLHKRALTKIRICLHKLKVETDRYNKQKID